jgi:hypothetical protein
VRHALPLTAVLLLALCGCASAARGIGTLQGRATIGPLSPAVRPGASPTPAPEVFTSRALAVFPAEGDMPLAEIAFDADGTYELPLPSGRYRVELVPSGIDRAAGLPAYITILPNRTTVLDVDIDTGIR